MSLNTKNDTGKKLVNKKISSSGESLAVQKTIKSPKKESSKSYQKSYDNAMSTATEALKAANDTIFRPEVVNGPQSGNQSRENEYAKQPGGPAYWKTSPQMQKVLENETMDNTKNYLNGQEDEAVFYQQQYQQQQNYGTGDPNIVAQHPAQDLFYGYPSSGFEGMPHATDFQSQPTTFYQDSGMQNNHGISPHGTAQMLAVRTGVAPKNPPHTQVSKNMDGSNSAGQILLSHDLSPERQLQYQRTWANANPPYVTGFQNAFIGNQQAAMQQQQPYQHGPQFHQYPQYQYQQQFSNQNAEQQLVENGPTPLAAGMYPMQPYGSRQGFSNQGWGYTGPVMPHDAQGVMQFLSNVEMTKQMAIEIASLRHEMGNLKMENENLKNSVPDAAAKSESPKSKSLESQQSIKGRRAENFAPDRTEQSENIFNDKRSAPNSVQPNSDVQSNSKDSLLAKKIKNQKVVRISNDTKRPGLLSAPAEQNTGKKTEKSKIKITENSKKNVSKNTKNNELEKQKKEKKQDNDDDILRKDSTEIAKFVKRSYKDAAMNSTSSLERSGSDISVGIENIKQSKEQSFQVSPKGASKASKVAMHTKEDTAANVSPNQNSCVEDGNSSDMSIDDSQNTSEKENQQIDKSLRTGNTKETADVENDDFVVADLSANDSTDIPFGKTTKIRIQTQKSDTNKQSKQLEQESAKQSLAPLARPSDQSTSVAHEPLVQQNGQSNAIPAIDNTSHMIKGYGRKLQPYLLYYDGKSSNCRTTFHKIEGTNIYDVRVKIDGSHVNPEKKFIMKTELNVCMPPGVHLLVDKPDETEDNKDLLFVKGHISSTSNGFLHITMKNKSDQKVELKAGMSIAKISFVADIDCIEAKLSSKVHQKIKENRTETNSQQYFTMINNYIKNNAKKVKYVNIGASEETDPTDSGKSKEINQTKFQHFIGNDFVKEIDKIYSLADIISKKSNSNNKNKKPNGKYSQIVSHTEKNSNHESSSSAETTNTFQPYKKKSGSEKKQQKSNTKIAKQDK